MKPIEGRGRRTWSGNRDDGILAPVAAVVLKPLRLSQYARGGPTIPASEIRVFLFFMVIRLSLLERSVPARRRMPRQS